MSRLTYLMAWLLCCGFTPSAQLQTNVDAGFAEEQIVQSGEKALKGKHRQLLANPRPMPDGSGGQFQMEVHEYVGPSGVGYTMVARIRQASCPDRPSGEPCVWVRFQHEGPEGHRDRGEGVWTLEPVTQ